MKTLSSHPSILPVIWQPTVDIVFIFYCWLYFWTFCHFLPPLKRLSTMFFEQVNKSICRTLSSEMNHDHSLANKYGPGVSLTTTDRLALRVNGLEVLVWKIDIFFVPKIIGPHLAPILFCFDLKFANFNCFFHSWIRLEKIFLKNDRKAPLKSLAFFTVNFCNKKPAGSCWSLQSIFCWNVIVCRPWNHWLGNNLCIIIHWCECYARCDWSLPMIY